MRRRSISTLLLLPMMLVSVASLARAGGAVTANQILHSTTNQNYRHRPQGAGDLNGDGYSDVVVPGAVDIRVLFGAAAGVGYGGLTILTPPDPNDGSTGATNTGRNVGVVGDLNGDGFDDLVIGAPTADRPGFPGTDDAGALYFYAGDSGPSGIATSPTQIVYGSYGGARLGAVVSRARDVNGDGYADVVAQEDPTTSSYAPARVFAGSASGIGGQIVSISNHFTYDPFVGIGDFDGDGYDDLARRDRSDTVTYPDGAVSLYDGGPTMKSVPSRTIGAPASGRVGQGAFGFAIAGPGDVDGDGYADLLIGDPGWAIPDPTYGFLWTHGRVDLYGGRSNGYVHAWTKVGDLWDDIGKHLEEVGDLNGDGYADFAITSDQDHPYNPLNPVQDTIPDYIHIYLGGDSGPLSTPTYWIEGIQATLSGFQTFAPAGAGDVDGDGYMDWIAPVNQTDLGVFHGRGASVSNSGDWVANGSASATALQGMALPRNGGDINGDGFDDVLVGAPGNNSGRGRANLFLGSATGPSLSADWSVYGASTGDSLGARVSILGDVDGDGWPEVAVAAPRANGHGEVRVYKGSTPVPSTTPTWILSGDQSGELFGTAITGVGDVDGDGYADVVVGSPAYDAQFGRIQLYLGGSSGLSTTPAWSAAGSAFANVAMLGNDVAFGDFDGDGDSDLAVGAPKSAVTNFFEGAVLVFDASALGLTTSPALTLRGSSAWELFGLTVARAGDVNADARDDLLVGAPGYSSGTGTPYGRVRLYQGTSTGLSASAFWWRDGTHHPNEQLGRCLVGLGDLDGDGAGDVAIAGFAEAVEVFAGGVGGSLSAIPSATLTPQFAGQRFGWSAGAAGDTDGDGFADLLVGEPDAYQPAYLGILGTAHLYRGNTAERSNAARPVIATQQIFGRSTARIFRDSYTDIQLVFDSQNPSGVVQHKMQHRIATFGTDLGSATVVTDGSWQRTAGTTFSTNVPGLSPGTSYHWQTRAITRNPRQPWTRWRNQGGWTPSVAMLRVGGTVDRPDLLVSACAPDTISNTSATSLSIWVDNQGSASCPASLLEVDLDGSLLVKDVAVPALGVGASTLVTVSIPAQIAGPHALAIDLDISNVAIESDEANNHFTKTLHSAAPAYLLVRADGTGDVPTIADALTAIADGGLIELADGTFTGAGNRNLTAPAKAFTLRSQSGNAGACIIDLQGTVVDPANFLSMTAANTAVTSFSNVAVRNGRSDLGGGLHLDGSKNASFTGLEFINCQGTATGPGAVWVRNGDNASFVNCAFAGCSSAADGGAVFADTGAVTSFDGCSFDGNSVGDDGGAVHADGASPTFTNCSFTNNTSPSAGGAVSLWNGSTATLSNSTFTGNSAGGGGAVYMTACSPTILGSVIADNTANWGGGLYLNAGASPSVAGCTLYANTGNTGGAAMSIVGSSFTLDHSIVAGHLGPGATIYCTSGGDPTLVSCDVWGNAGGDYTGCVAADFGVNGNISADPQFCLAGGPFDLTLNSTSPCVNNPGWGQIGALGVGCTPPPTYLLVRADGSGDVATIADAFTAIAEGGVIELADGIFTGDGNRDLDPAGKMFTLRSQSGNASACVLDAQGTASVQHRHLTIQSGEGSGLRIANITFTGGYRGYGGSVLVSNAVSPVFEGCRFVGNQGGINSGAIHSVGTPSPTFLRCEFQSNAAVTNVGGVGTLAGTPTFRGCTFDSNTAVYGAALYFGDTTTATIDSCLFVDNTSNSYAGAITNRGAQSSSVVTRSTFHGNGAASAAHIYAFEGASVSVSQSILTGGTGGAAVVVASAATADFTCTDVWNNAGGDWVSGIAGQGTDPVRENISADPMYCDVHLGVYTLASASPALAGNHACMADMGMLGQGCTVVGNDPAPVPTAFALEGAYPNPFNPRTTIRFDLSTAGRVRLTIYRADGRSVRHLVRDAVYSAGGHDVIWTGEDDHGRSVASGVYFARLEAEGRQALTKLALVR